MRHIYYIFAIVVILSIFFAFNLFFSRPPKEDPALIINGKIITAKELKKLYADLLSLRTSHKNKTDFINSLITKELLIQEAQKEDIDKEESFRLSIQDFYEQSLIKTLMDRKFASLKTDVTDEAADRYLDLSNKIIHLTQFDFDTFDDARKRPLTGGEKKVLPFQDLCKDVQYALLALKEGGLSEPVGLGEKYIVFRLDRTEGDSAQKPSEPLRGKVKEMLTKDKKEIIVNNWIADLKKSATIKILKTED